MKSIWGSIKRLWDKNQSDDRDAISGHFRFEPLEHRLLLDGDGLLPGGLVGDIPVPEPGTIIIEKQTEPHGASDRFTFTGDASGSIPDGGQIIRGTLEPGAYTVQEIIPVGWELIDIVVDDDNSTIDLADARVHFQVEAGETVTAVFYNRLPLDYGDAPDSYGTLLASDGARHALVSGHHMGPIVDAEPDGQPSPNADGDDLNGTDDGDGVTLAPTYTAGDPTATVIVDGGPLGGMLDAWIDYNGNGLFDGLAEHLWGGTSQSLNPGPNTLTFAVPIFVNPGPSYARFRLSVNGNLSPTGFAPDGEVEDYLVQIDAVPQPGTIIVEKQTEPDGTPGKFTFTGDAAGSIPDGGQIIVANLAPGTYTSQEIVPVGWELIDIVVDDDNSTIDLADSRVNFQLEPGETVKATFYNSLPLDYGDAPDSYGTLLASDGARHGIIPGPYMGSIVEAEPDGQPSPNADGDDLNGVPDDEDGVTLAPLYTAGDPAATVTVDGGPVGALLDAWIDFDGNGVFDHAAEHLWGGTSQLLLAGPNTLTFAVPATAVSGPTYARFRVSSNGNLLPTGYAADGEVEDYRVQIDSVNQSGFIIVEKQTDPDGSTESFEFSTDYSSNFFLSDDETHNSGPLAPGTYSVAELVPANWTLVSATSNDGSDPSAIDLDPGETVTVTFVNQADPGTIIVEKQTDPDGWPESFEFSTDFGPNFTLSDDEAFNSGPLAPGTYSVTELVPANWTLVSATSDDGSDPSAIDLDPGETVTVTFVNQADPGTIIVEKQTEPDGSTESFEFSTDYSANFTLSDDETHHSGPLTPGTYSVSELVPAGWNLTSAISSDGSDPSAIDLDPGETVTVTFINTQEPVLTGTIIVEKQTDPDGAPDSFTFSGDASGSIADNGQIVVSNLTPGAYTAQEIVPAGWELVDIVVDDDNSTVNLADFRVNFQVEAGETVKATFYNRLPLDYGDAPDNYGTLLASNGARHAIVPGHHLGPIVDAEPDGQPSSLANGDDLNGIPDDEDGVILAPTYTPGDPAATLIVDGGPSGGMLDAWIDFNNNGVFDHPAEHLWGGVSQVLTPGPNPPLTFALPATAVPGPTYARFRLSNSGGLMPTGFASEGEVEDYGVEIEAPVQPGTIIVEKQTDPDGWDESFEFSTSYSSNFTLSDDETHISGPLVPGLYSVAELVPAGWTLVSATSDDGSDPSAIYLDPGETVTVTFINQADPGTIIVEKQTDPDGRNESFEFTTSYGPNFTLSDDQTHNSGPLTPGVYSVSELVPTNWTLVSATSDDGSDPSAIDLDPGETVTVTFINQADPGTIIVEKQTDPDGWPESFEFSTSYGPNFTLSDEQTHTSGPLAPGVYSVAEIVTANWTLVSATSDDGSDPSAIDLDPGETVTVTFINEADPGTIIVEKQTNPDGSTESFEFSTSYSPNFTLSDDQTHNSGPLTPGIYSVSELVPAGWNLTDVTSDDGSDPSAIGLDPGEIVTVTFTNNLEMHITSFVSDATMTDLGQEGHAVTFTAIYEDDGLPHSYSALFSWGDGSSSTVAAGGGVVTAEHIYDTGGIYDVNLVLEDEAGNSDEADTQAIVQGVGLHDGQLQIIGSTGHDYVQLSMLPGNEFRPTEINVFANFLPLSAQNRTYLKKDIDNMLMLMNDGNDQVNVSGRVKRDMLIDGGAGDDNLMGGYDNDILLGGSGNDILQGSRGRDILIGGEGRDTLLGGHSQDLLIGGYTPFGSEATGSGLPDLTALWSIHAEWNSSRSQDKRRNNLTNTDPTPDRLNNGYYLILGETIFDDGDFDTLLGGRGNNWLWE